MDTNLIRERLGEEWLPDMYAEIRQLRTRAYVIDVPEKENSVEIMHTLLGIEVKIGKKRFATPDLASARYVRIFARIGCREFAIPYDITKISAIADDLETAWQKMLLFLEAENAGRPARSLTRARSNLVRAVRTAIADIGAGDLMPEFKQSTKQRADR